MEMRSSRKLTIWFKHTCLCLGLATVSAAHADEAEAIVRVVTTKSTAGSVGVRIEEATPKECRALAKRISVNTSTPFETRELNDCEFALLPAKPLAQGERCIEIPGFSGLLEQPCFDVTGIAAEFQGGPTSIFSVGPGSLQPSSCHPCTDGSSEACTQLAWFSNYIASAPGDTPDELWSAYAFAAAWASGGRVPRPAASEFHVMDPGSIEVTVLAPSSAQSSCIALYLRAFESGEIFSYDQNCVTADGSATQPVVFDATLLYCDPDYVSHWCADNRSDCSGSDLGSAYVACESYSTVCAPGFDAGIDLSPPPRTDTVEVAPDDQDAGASSGTAKTAKGKGGCSAVPGSQEPWIDLAMSVVGIVWFRCRRRAARL